MKRMTKRLLAIVLSVMLIAGCLPAGVLPADAASYTYNWGTRGTLATELSAAAKAWYEAQGTSLEALMKLSGASGTGAVPGSALYKRLKALMTDAHDYKTSYDATRSLYQYTDCQNGGGKISSFYSGTAIGPAWGQGSWNREHTWPDSKGLGGHDETDIMMLRPTATSENSSRGNTAYGQSSGYYHPNSESNSKYDLRGDVARIFLYVYTRWGNTGGNSKYGTVWGTKGVMESREVLLEWMEADPVDTWELGRNDAVESITGTRNVFVDFPELAFQLFDTEVPANYATPTTGELSAYTITASVNDDSCGSVSVSGKTITAYPVPGCRVSGYRVTSGTATVIQSGNTFRVTAESDCTVLICFEKIPEVTVSYYHDLAEPVTLYAGSSLTLPSVQSPDGFRFLGWTESQLTADTTTRPVILTGSYAPQESRMLYPVYSYSVGGSGSAQYVQTALADIPAAANVVISSARDGSYYYMSATQTVTKGAPKNGILTTKTEDGQLMLADTPDESLMWNVEKTADGTYIFYPAGQTDTWLYCINDNDGIRIGSESNKEFRINTGSEGYLYNIGTKRYLGAYSDHWRCYGSASQANIANQSVTFFAGGNAGTVYYTADPVVCQHENARIHEAVAATCTQPGYTEGLWCPDCQKYVSGHETVDATGHSWRQWNITVQPGCTTPGVQCRSCNACGETETASVDAAGHSWGQWSPTVQPGCITPGVQCRSCSSCGETETQSTEPVGHDWGQWTVTREPACGIAGEKSRSCNACGSVDICETDPLTHNYILSGVTYTCEHCGDHYDTWWVHFSVPEGVTDVADAAYTENMLLPEAHSPVGYHFVGWTDAATADAVTAPVIYPAGDRFTCNAQTTLYALYSYTVGEEGGNGDYVKVTESRSDWSGEYLLVYEDGENACIFDSSLSSFKYASNNKNYVRHAFSGNTIPATVGDAYKFTVSALTGGGYSFLGTSGKYMGCSGEKGMTTSSSALKLNIRFANGEFTFTNPSGGLLRWNIQSPRFQFYGASSQNMASPAMYIKSGTASVTHYTTAPVVEKVLDGMSVSLGGDIRVNFKLTRVTDAVQITVGGIAAEPSVRDGVLSVSIAAAQMNDPITIKVIRNGQIISTSTCTVRQYGLKILDGEYDEPTKAMIRQMLLYGGAAQIVFDHNTDNLASDGITGTDSEIDASAVTDMYAGGAIEGVCFYGASVLYKDQIAVRFYFTGSVEGCVFKVGDTEYTPVAKADMSYIEVADIKPQNLAKQITLTVSSGDSTITVRYSPLNYIVRMNEKATTTDSVKALLKALYQYHLAAKQLKGEA